MASRRRRLIEPELRSDRAPIRARTHARRVLPLCFERAAARSTRHITLSCARYNLQAGSPTPSPRLCNNWHSRCQRVQL